jgi:2'-phosphotransferase
VDTNDKKRYELLEQRPGVYYIRASQGHSLKSVESQDLLEEIKEPVTTPVIHGTSNKAWESIKIQGLSKMRRNHVHFAIGLPGDENVKSGMRKTSEVFIYIDVEKARTGTRFKLCNNFVGNGIFDSFPS